MTIRRARRVLLTTATAVALAASSSLVAAQGAASARTRASTARSALQLPIDIGGSYRPIVGDFDGDGRSDIFLYSPTAPDVIWFSGPILPPAQHVAVRETVQGEFQPFVGDFNGDRRSDIFWYRPGNATSSVWIAGARAGRFTHRHLNVGGTDTPLVGTFASSDPVGDERQDIYWYSGVPGGTDRLWESEPDGSFRPVATAPTRPGASPLVGNFEGDTNDEILFYQPGGGAQDLVAFGTDGEPQVRSLAAPGTGPFTPLVGDFYPESGDMCCSSDGTGFPIDDIVWYGPGRAPDAAWQFAGDRSGKVTIRPFRQDATLTPIVTTSDQLFEDETIVDERGGAAIAWYDPARGRIGSITGLPVHAVPIVADFNGRQSVYVNPLESSHGQASSDSSDLLLFGPGSAPDRVLIDLG